MTRTFVNGEVSAEVARAARHRPSRRSRRPAPRRDRGSPAASCTASPRRSIEHAGYPTQRTRSRGERLTHGFYFGLGHGVGLEVHEPPWLGFGSQEPLVAGDVLAIEPGIEGLERIGGVRYEDLLLITEDGCETLTRYPYDL